MLQSKQFRLIVQRRGVDDPHHVSIREAGFPDRQMGQSWFEVESTQPALLSGECERAG
jgi:hypothetical protein